MESVIMPNMKNLSPSLLARRRLSMKRKESVFFQNGKIVSSRMLLEKKQSGRKMSMNMGELSTPTEDGNVSALYLPAKKRNFKDKDATSPVSGLTDSPSGKRV
jgi:hypothetical protein